MTRKMLDGKERKHVASSVFSLVGTQVGPAVGRLALCVGQMQETTHLSRWLPTTTSFSSTMLGWRRRRSSVISRRLLMGMPETKGAQ